MSMSMPALGRERDNPMATSLSHLSSQSFVPRPNNPKGGITHQAVPFHWAVRCSSAEKLCDTIQILELVTVLPPGTLGSSFLDAGSYPPSLSS